MPEKKGSKEKVLSRISKKSSKQDTNDIKNLKNQYHIIRDDILKLRSDLQRGYDMAREMVDKRTILKEILKTK